MFPELIYNAGQLGVSTCETDVKVVLRPAQSPKHRVCVVHLGNASMSVLCGMSLFCSIVDACCPVLYGEPDSP